MGDNVLLLLLVLLVSVPTWSWMGPLPLSSRAKGDMRMAALKPGDRVVVIGVTGGVGQLTTAR